MTRRQQFILPIDEEIIVDNFAGGDGASMGIEMALGRHVDVAINHDAASVALHAANHPQTRHFCEDVFKVEPRAVTQGRRVGLAWFSPDCKHFSKAKGGKPRSKKIRGLAWVAVKWAALERPRVIVLENVEEFEDWGPLLKDGSPCPRRKGQTFKSFVKRLVNLGYAVEWRELKACDYGAPTIRKRLFLIARRDGKPIVWPAGGDWNPRAKRLGGVLKKVWTAAQCIDWSLPCPSIFLTSEEAKVLGVKRPLAEATMRRLYRGIIKFVIEAKEPFIVSLTHQGGDRVEAVTEPFKTLTGAHRGEKALAVPFMQQKGHYKSNSGMTKAANEPLRTQTTRAEHMLVSPFLTEHANGSTQRNFDADEAMRTQCAEVKGGHFALCTAFLNKYHGDHQGRKDGAQRNHSPEEPMRSQDTSNRFGIVAANLMVNTSGHSGGAADAAMPTIPTGGHHALVASHLSKFYGTNTGQATYEALHSITAQGQHIAHVEAFLMKYYGEGGQDQPLSEPLHTVPTRDRFGLVTVEGRDYQIADIGMRMLVPRELYLGQGFPPDYIIQIELDAVRNGKLKRVKLSQEAQVRMCGNSVCPPVAAAIVAANVPEMARRNI